MTKGIFSTRQEAELFAGRIGGEVRDFGGGRWTVRFPDHWHAETTDCWRDSLAMERVAGFHDGRCATIDDLARQAAWRRGDAEPVESTDAEMHERRGA